MSDQSRPPEAHPSEAGLSRELGVLVGFDGSDLAALAVRSGAVEAQRRNTTLTVVTAYALPTMIYPNMASLPSEPEDEKAKREAESTLAEAAELLREHPGETSFGTETGHAARVLATTRAAAERVIVGARGRRGSLGRLLGSASTALPARAHWPTVVVARRTAAATAADGPVVVAGDGSDTGRVAMFPA